METRRAFGAMAAAGAFGPVWPALAQPPAPCHAPAIPGSVDQQSMRLAIAAARGNKRFPFGAVIISAQNFQVLATGVNNTAANPMFHGEIAAMNDYVAKHGNQGWDQAVLYTTGESCPMCMSAMVWAGMAGVVYGTSIAKLRAFGINQILIPSAAVTLAAPFYCGFIRGPVLEAETDALFQNRERP
jgi:tRNA(adenine34) deaminase